MTSGGARARSGPAPDPGSGRSAARGLDFQALPSEGYKGQIPDFPLDPIVLFSEHFEDGAKVREVDHEASADFHSREGVVWVEAWRSPQGAAWAVESWRWPVIGEYCRLKVAVELDPGANAALVGQLHRYREQIGLTPAGLRLNGWQVARDEVGARRDGESVPGASSSGGRLSARERRLKAVGDGR
ncbi:hypothetical protein [Paenarthrobacter sp. NPDC018779]|uniref:hypothetical protein n=1 Tax=Paenarthrobacter sp. NPDC018779 TaxID=3364375 RepID=UPI0037CB06F9